MPHFSSRKCPRPCNKPYPNKIDLGFKTPKELRSHENEKMIPLKKGQHAARLRNLMILFIISGTNLVLPTRTDGTDRNLAFPPSV